ncbi:MAG: putative lipid II flippase FtsW [Lentisphaerae bacterium]|nr:putative lipid II flippase FtsW [Lentisphaerota bacterium]
MLRTSSLLLVCVLCLVCVGVVMLASTSGVKGSSHFDDPHFFLKRQLVWLMVAVGVGLALFRFDYHWWLRVAPPLAVASILLLGLVFVPGIGAKVGGSNRWLRLGPFSLQPSEFAKLSTVIVLSAWMAHIGRRAARLKEGLILPMAFLGVVLILMILEPDFGTTLLTGAVGFMLLYGGGTKLGHLAVTGMLGLCGFVLAILRDPLRLGRVMALFVPEDHPVAAYHLAQSKVAFIKGEWVGAGLGESIQKQFYLPEAHTDFILAIIGEELGFVATGGVVILFIGIVVCGLTISLNAPDPFGSLLAFGLTMMISLQAAINIGVVTGCLPTKGLPLPFISYGGSSLVVSIAAVSILLNVARHAMDSWTDEHTRIIQDRAHNL